MAMCTSGSLSICATAGTCRSIGTAVASTTSGSLSCLSLCAGKPAPHCMREFYGYSSTKSVKWCQPSVSGGVSIKCTQRRIANGSYITYTGVYTASLNSACITGYRVYVNASGGGSGSLTVAAAGGTFCTQPGGGSPPEYSIAINGITCGADHCFCGSVSN